MRKKTIPKRVLKKETPKKISKKKKVIPKIKTLKKEIKVPKEKKIEIKEKILPTYKEEIIVAGKTVKRLHDGRDTDKFFHCTVNGKESTRHIEKELFLIKK